MTFTASPNPLPEGVNVVTISWNAPAYSSVQITVNSPTGTLFGTGGSSGSGVTGPWVTPGMQFFLMSGSTQIASLTIAAPAPVVPPTFIPPPPIGKAIVSPKGMGSTDSLGIRGDGVTDVTAELNKMLATYSPCFITAGDYLISGPLNVVNSGMIFGDGRGITEFIVKPGSAVNTVFHVTAPHVRFQQFSVNGNIQSGGVSWGIAPWKPNTQYYANPATGGAWYGGGADCVYYSQFVYRCVENHTSNSQFDSSFWDVLEQLTPAQISNMQNAILFSVWSSGDVQWNDIEMTGSQFGIFLYSGQQYMANNCYAHDFGVEYTGNNSTLDAMHSMPGVVNVRRVNCDFENLYVPNGPGASAASFDCASDVIQYGNRVYNCSQVGGGVMCASGVAVTNPPTLPVNWITALNIIERTGDWPWPTDYSDGIELEVNRGIAIGNITSGYEGSVTMSSLDEGTVAGPFAIGLNIGAGIGSPLPDSIGVAIAGYTNNVTVSANTMTDFAVGVNAADTSQAVTVASDQQISGCPVPVQNKSKQVPL